MRSFQKEAIFLDRNIGIVLFGLFVLVIFSHDGVSGFGFDSG